MTLKPSSELPRLYLELMKLCLTNSIYRDAETFVEVHPRSLAKRAIAKLIRLSGYTIGRRHPISDWKQRQEGLDWPPLAHTMIGHKRLDNIQYCVENILSSNVPGDLIETGVWRGGACIFMRALLKAYGVSDRSVWVADSFLGLPPPNPERFPQDKGLNLFECSELAVSLDEVRRNFEAYGLLDGQVRFLQGWFRDTLPSAPLHQLALLRMDGDLYESTMDALQNLYPRVSQGGYVIVDDYGEIQACKSAVEDFRRINGISDEVTPIDSSGVFWRKGRPSSGN